MAEVKPPPAAPKTDKAPTAVKTEKVSAAAIAAAEAAAKAEAEQRFRETMAISTFANLELTSAQATMRQYQQLYEQAKLENMKLEGVLKERDKDALQVMEYLRSELESKNTALREAQLRLERCREEFDRESEGRIAQLNRTITGKDEAIEELRQQLAETRAKLADLSQFEIERQHLNFTISKLKEAERDLILTHEKELTKIKFASLEEKVKLRAVEKAMNERFETEVDERAMQRVDQKSQQIRETNMGLIKQKAQLERDVARLTAQVRSTQEAMDLAQREADLARESHAEYARQGSKLTRIARESTKTARELEVKCSDITRAMGAQLEAAEQRHKEEVAALRSELRHAKDTAESLKKGFEQMRELTKQVLDQRSDLENFFFDAIEYTRAQAAAEAGTSLTPRRDSLTAAMAPRVAAGHRGDMDARESVVKSEPLGSQSARTVKGFTGAMETRGQGTFLSMEGLEGIGSTVPSLTPRAAAGRERSGRQQYPPSVAMDSLASGGARTMSRPVTRDTLSRPSTLPHLGSAVTLGGGGAVSKVQSPRQQQPDTALGQRLALPEPSTATTAVVGNSGAALPSRFSQLSWADKEKVISALLMELNRTFYQGHAPAIPRLAQPTSPQEDDLEDWRRSELPPQPQQIAAAPSAAAVVAAAAFPSTARASVRPPQPPPRPGAADSRPPTGNNREATGSVAPPPPQPPTGVLSALRGSKPSSAASARSSAGSQRKATIIVGGESAAPIAIGAGDPSVE